MSSDWQICKLGELGRIVTGKTPKTADASNFGGRIPFVTPTDMDGRKTISCTARYLTVTGASSVKGSIIPAGAVMVSCIGSDMGKSVIAGQDCVTNQQINSIVVDKRFSNEFVYYNLSMRKAELQHLASGGSTMPILNKGHFSELDMALPPLPEQKQIAGLLGALDDRIALLRETNTTLEAIAQALFKSWFVDFDPVRAKQEGREPEGMDAATAALFPDSFEESELGLVPKGWRVDSIYSAAQLIYGAPFASSKFNSDGVGKPLIRIRDLKNEAPGVFTPEVHPKGYLVQPGDIVVGMDGEFRAYLWGGEEAWLNQRVCVFVPVAGVPATFVHRSIMPILAAVEASETATTVIHLGKNDIDRFRIIIPGESVLKAFGEITDSIYQRVVEQKQAARTLATLRDTLLPRLISGQLRLPDAEALVGEV